MKKTGLFGILLIEFAVIFGFPILFNKSLSLANSYRNGMTIYSAPIYTSPKEIFKDFEKEKKKLALKDVTINLEIKDKTNFTARTWKIREDHYHMQVNPRYLNRLALRHDLFHVERMHSGKYMNYPILDGIEEWMATSYALEETQNP